MVVWIIGLSGSGKTTLSRRVVDECRRSAPNVVLVDGDEVRAMFGDELGHTIADRRKNAERICRLSKFLDDQGIHVVCAILSLFPESREWNRRNLENYYEVFIDTPIADLQSRDSKGIYARYADGKIKDVAGLDLEFKRPDADLQIENIGSRDELLGYASRIAAKVVGRPE
jgi:adenylylsulfate kinase-like enzyme